MNRNTESVQGKETEQTGIALIASERQRQVSEEGWTPEHDDTHNKGELALLAVYYALDESQRKEWSKKTGRNFSADWLKPTPHDRVRELIKAGALIAAEIDRLKRASIPEHLPMKKHCPGPRQHGHPLVYESHCDHGETEAHDIRNAPTPKSSPNNSHVGKTYP